MEETDKSVGVWETAIIIFFPVAWLALDVVVFTSTFEFRAGLSKMSLTSPSGTEETKFSDCKDGDKTCENLKGVSQATTAFLSLAVITMLPALAGGVLAWRPPMDLGSFVNTGTKKFLWIVTGLDGLTVFFLALGVIIYATVDREIEGFTLPSGEPAKLGFYLCFYLAVVVLVMAAITLGIHLAFGFGACGALVSPGSNDSSRSSKNKNKNKNKNKKNKKSKMEIKNDEESGSRSGSHSGSDSRSRSSSNHSNCSDDDGFESDDSRRATAPQARGRARPKRGGNASRGRRGGGRGGRGRQGRTR